MAYTVTTNQTIANFQAEISKVLEILKRGGHPANLVSPATLTALAGLVNSTNGTTEITLS